jgi:hypothetical protein
MVLYFIILLILFNYIYFYQWIFQKNEFKSILEIFKMDKEKMDVHDLLLDLKKREKTLQTIMLTNPFFDEKFVTIIFKKK